MTLGEKYREAMDRIAVTEAMRGRILEKLRRTETAAEKKVVPFPRRRRYWALAACLALLVTGALVLPHALPKPQTNPAGSGEPPCTQNANSIVEYPSPQALSQAVGFPVADLTHLPFPVSGTVYLDSFGDLAEIDYTGSGGQTAVYRKSPGTDDNSGVYDAFPQETQITAGDVTAALKGTEGAYTLATWTDGTYAYSVSLSEGIGEAAWSEILAGAQ